MITNQGRDMLRMHLASSGLYGGIALGIGQAAPTVTDTRLEYEIAKIPAAYTTFDFAAGKVVVRGAVPSTVAGRVTEVALIPTSHPDLGESSLLSTFDTAVEDWSAGTNVTANTRVGASSLRVSAAAGATATSTYSLSPLDLSSYLENDTIGFAFFNGGNVSSVSVTFGVDSGNYYIFTRSAPPAGYNLQRWTKGQAAVTGAPNWGTINFIEVAVTATSAGTGFVDCDALRIDRETLSTERFIINRNVIAPVQVNFGSTADFETVLGVTF